MARKRGLGENAVDTAWAKKDEILNQGCERGEEASGDETRPRRLTRKSTELDQSLFLLTISCVALGKLLNPSEAVSSY